MEAAQWMPFLETIRTEVVAGCIIGIIDEGNKRAYLTIEGTPTLEGEKLYKAWEDAGMSPPTMLAPSGSIEPTTGGNNTPAVIVGSNFGQLTAECLITIGAERQTPIVWEDTSIQLMVVRGKSVFGAPLAVDVTIADGQRCTTGSFTFVNDLR